MKYILSIILFISLISCTNKKEIPNNGLKLIEQIDWKTYFDDAKVNGTFILSKLNSDSILVYNPTRSVMEYLPASTFKILNSLISLETKAVQDENEIIKWDGEKRFLDTWNKDQNMRSALKYSCVWFYQELARRVGEEKMQMYLDSVHYGNSKIGSDIDKFWLEGDLRISAIGQFAFLTKFLDKELPFSDKNIGIVKDIMKIDSTESYQLYAKTGWSARAVEKIGWFVGFVEVKSETWIFAMNIDLEKNENAKYREAITRSVLKEVGLIN